MDRVSRRGKQDVPALLLCWARQLAMRRVRCGVFENAFCRLPEELELTRRPLHVALFIASFLISLALAVPVEAQDDSLTFTRVAGSDGGAGFFDGVGPDARFNQPSGIAVDADGNLYVSDSDSYTIRKISPDGLVSTLGGVAGDHAPGGTNLLNAGFGQSQGLAVDHDGNLYVAEGPVATIRKITPRGQVSVLAGELFSGGVADGLAGEARFRFPRDVAVDAAGNVYVADAINHNIRKISPAGMTSTIAGVAGEQGSADGPGSEARFSSPSGIAVDGAGIVYVADAGNHTIRMIGTDGVVSTLAGQAGEFGWADGTADIARFWSPRGIAIDASGTVVVADSQNSRIRTITPEGVVATWAGAQAGSDDGNGVEAGFNYPQDIAADGSGNVFVADTSNHKIRKITAAGVVSTIAGKSSESGRIDATGSAARLAGPQGVVVRGDGTAYVADSVNYSVREITPAGVVTTFAGGSYGTTDGTASEGKLGLIGGITADSSNNLYVADTVSSTIRKITPGGAITTLAGLAGERGSVDGTGGDARFYGPWGVGLDGEGNLYVADTFNHTIRRITPAGEVSTFAGVAGQNGSTDGVAEARFDQPVGIAVDGSGNVFVADSGNNTIRRITDGGEVSTFAGLALHPGSVDGKGEDARFMAPYGLAIDGTQNLWVTDRRGQLIRKITPDGVVTTVGGKAFQSGNVEGKDHEARVSGANGIAVAGDGALWITDHVNHAVFVGRPGLPDIAMVDSPIGEPGDTRTLFALPETSTERSWRVVRRPGGSIATLSSSSASTPTFTPDKRGRYVIRLDANLNGLRGISTVQLNATSARRRAVGPRP